MVELSRRAKKDLASLPPALREKASTVIDQLDTDPAIGKKLKGKLSGLRSTRLGRTHRIIYRVAESGPEVITIAQRRDAYR
jgi:addiction module RelE/StbE family toxin